MLALTSVADRLQATLDEPATTEVRYVVAYQDRFSQRTLGYGEQLTLSSDTSTVTILDSPSVFGGQAPRAGVTRQAIAINIFNNDSIAHTITVYYNRGGTLYVVLKIRIDAGYTVNINANGVVSVKDTNGAVLFGDVATPGSTSIFLNHWNGADEGTTFTDEVVGVSWAITSGSGQNTETSAPQFGSAALEYTLTGQVRATGFTGRAGADFTIEGFARPDLGATAGIALYSSTTSANCGVNVDELNNQVQLFVLNAAGATIYNEVASISVAASVYKHVALVYDHSAGTITGYFDGALFKQATGMDTAGYNLDIGVLGYSVGGMWDETRLTDAAEYSGASYTIPTGEFS